MMIEAIQPFNIHKDNIGFFQFIKTPLFQIGILLMSFSISMMVYGIEFLYQHFFHLKFDLIIYLSILFGRISGGMIGLDGSRVF